MGRRSRRKMEKWLETKQMKLSKQTLKQIIKEELDVVMSEASGDPEYDNEYDLVANNIKTQPGFLEFAMRSLEDSYGNRFYNHSKARIGFYLTLLGQHAREGEDSYGGTVEGHIASIQGKLAEHPDLLTPAGRGRLDALLDHLKQNY